MRYPSMTIAVDVGVGFQARHKGNLVVPGCFTVQFFALEQSQLTLLYLKLADLLWLMTTRRAFMDSRRLNVITLRALLRLWLFLVSTV